jgi:hypothetical protein
MAQIDFPSHVVVAFASSLLPARWQLDNFLQLTASPIKDSLEELMLSIDEQALREQMSQPDFRFLHNGAQEAAFVREAREEIISSAMDRKVNQERMKLLRATGSSGRVAPYNHPALLDLPIGDDNLVDLAAFGSSSRMLERNGFVFELAPTLPAVNSSYWLMQNLQIEHGTASRTIRLDPLAIQREDSYRSPVYKMLVYGVPLDWSGIAALREDDHGRWMPDDLRGTGVAFTDFVWSPRAEEVHFACEEVPSAECVDVRGSRYLHAIFLRRGEHFIHVDGAIRYYSSDELDCRLHAHLRNAGKAGQRVKIFRVEGSIPTDAWGGLVGSFFVWNQDVYDYVTGKGAMKAV